MHTIDKNITFGCGYRKSLISRPPMDPNTSRQSHLLQHSIKMQAQKHQELSAGHYQLILMLCFYYKRNTLFNLKKPRSV